MTKENPLYVGIQDPVEVRRTILESSKGVLKNLQLYEDIKNIQTQRLKIEVILNGQLKEIKSLIRKTRLKFPKVKTGSTKAYSSLESELADLEKEISTL